MPPRRVHPFLAGHGPLALAHRGGAAEAPENSPAAFQHAVDLGFRYIETDVRATRDGTAIVMHDARLDRTTDRTGAVALLTAREVLAAHLRSGEHPMTLAWALARWPDVRFNVDVKSDDAVVPFLAAVDRTDAWDRVCAASFSTRRLHRLRALGGAGLATSMGPREVARLVSGVPGRPAALAAQVPQRAGRVRLVTSQLIRRAHALGLHVHVWTIDDPAAMHTLLDLGADGIVTDRPSALRQVLEQRDQWT
jgi:glycerophosphoryl diester phosphodiesterase